MEDNQNHSTRITLLMARKMGQAATEEELTELESLLQQYPSYRFLEEVAGTLCTIPTAAEQQLPERDELQLPKKKGVTAMLSGKYRIAASVTILLTVAGLAAGLYLTKKQKLFNTPLQEVATHNGTTWKTVLPDGTRVWLNSGSRLRFPAAFTGSKRQVQLDGEAFFEVAQQAGKPFIVTAGDVAINVLGTSFNVKAYPQDKHFEATLISGKIQVVSTGESIVLQPHQKVVITGNTAAKGTTAAAFRVQPVPVNVHDSSVVTETAWKDNMLAFSDESFESVATKMERWYDIHIHFESAALREEKISGVFEAETIREAMTVLQMTTRFHYRISGRDIYLSE